MPIPTFPVGTRVRIKINGALVEANYAGWSERYNMPTVKLDNGRVIPRKIFGTVTPVVPTAAVSTVVNDGTEVIAPTVTAAQSPVPVNFDINQRFTFLEQLVDMVITKSSNSLIVTGPGGLGKTHTVTERLKMAGLKEEDDFTIVRGYSTPKSLYRALFENVERLVVFDDCDSVLEHPTSLNILKGALDSYAIRNISWLTERPDENLPDTFEFRGSIVFISNKNISDISQPILSRALFVDLSMTAVEKMTRMAAILPQLRPDVAIGAKRECLNLIDEIKDQMPDLTLRSLLKTIDLRLARPDDWKNLARYVNISGSVSS